MNINDSSLSFAVPHHCGRDDARARDDVRTELTAVNMLFAFAIWTVFFINIRFVR